MSANLDELEQRTRRMIAAARQEHLLAHYEHLADDAVRERYLRDLLALDLADMERLFARAHATATDGVRKLDELMAPLGAEQIEAEEGVDEETRRRYYERGLLEIAYGRVGVILMAGGQGSRLGVSYPKGMYNVGLLSAKTLFQLQAERIGKVQALARAKYPTKSGRITWYIMTSGPTYDDTVAFLRQHNYFGLDADDVVLFQQGLLPCFDFAGRILLANKGQLALAPDGNGGIYRALERNGVLDDFQRRGVKYLHCHSVDNILVKVADPTFIGYCVEKDADCGAKVVQKNSPTECVGVLCRVENRVQVVEYSEITDETAHARHADGNLVFNAGNICNHYFSADFLRRIAALEMPLHVAKKKIPHVDGTGEVVRPAEPNGIKIEKFVFDVFAFSDRFVAWEVPRDSEFSALKNADTAGRDCPRTAKADLYRLHRTYLERAGCVVDGDEVEISPQLSYAGEGLEHLQGTTVAHATLLQ